MTMKICLYGHDSYSGVCIKLWFNVNEVEWASKHFSYARMRIVPDKSKQVNVSAKKCFCAST